MMIGNKMGLLSSTQATTTPPFETDDDEPAVATQATPTPAVAQVTKPNLTLGTTPTEGAVALNTPKPTLTDMKDALPVDYNTLDQVIVNAGNLLYRESKVVLGDTITLDILSYQASFVVSPGDDKAPKESVKFSADGITCSDGTLVAEHLALLRTVYPKAALKERVVLVGAILDCVKDREASIGNLVQLDLSPQSKTQWDRYKAKSQYAIATGTSTMEIDKRVKVTAELSTIANNTFTKATFARATA